MIFRTRNLQVRKAVESDIELYLSLWNNPLVMRNVGFPDGLKTSAKRIRKQLNSYGESEFDRTLVVVEKKGGNAIGECKLGFPDKEKISTTDIKFLPEYWRKGFGKELKNALCKYLFRKTDCRIVEASPNVENIASQKMQEAFGGKEVRRGTYHFPKQMQHFTEDVNCVIYHIHKADWLRKNLEIKEIIDQNMKRDICRKVLRKLPRWFGIESATLEYISGVSDKLFLAAVFDGEVVGFYAISDHFPETSEIYVCGILPDFHKLGIGRNLQEETEHRLRGDGKQFLTVKTLSFSHPDENYAMTRKFYYAMGFQPLEEFIELWGKENPCLFLIKSLNIDRKK